MRGEISKVHLIPAHPCEGWISMNRCWEEILRCAPLAKGRFAVESVLPFPGLRAPRGSKLARVFFKQLAYPAIVRARVRSGVAHVLDHSYVNMLSCVPGKVAKVVTVHDLIPLREPENLTAAEIARFRSKMERLKRADLLLPVSEYTRRELIDLLGIDEQRMLTVPNGVVIPAHPAVDLPMPVERPYVLSVGSTLKRKGLDLLAPIMAAARAVIPDLVLVRVGNRLSDEMAEDIRKRGGRDVLVEMGIVPDEMLDVLYRHAQALLMTSRYEGFGLPLLEAMARNCPVISTYCASLPEVGGDAVMYFSDDCPDEAANHLVRLVQDSALQYEVRQRGNARAREFCWAKSFEKTISAYERVLA